MALTEDERHHIGLIAESVAKQIGDNLSGSLLEVLDKKLKDGIQIHVETCPVGKRFENIKNRMIGVLIGSIIASGATGGGIATLILKLTGG